MTLRGRHAWRSSTKRVFYIYVLVDPRDGLPRYVGCTMNPRTRLASHLAASPSSEGNRRRCDWVRELRELSLRPKMMGLGRAVGFKAAMSLEAKWIEKGWGRGWPLFNGRKQRELKPVDLEPYVEVTRQ